MPGRRKRRRSWHGINPVKPPQKPYMPFNPAMKAPLHGPAVPSWAEDDSHMTEPNKLPHHDVPDAPACGGRHCRARAGGRGPAISRRPQSRAARGGGNAGRTGAGAGRRRHRQDPVLTCRIAHILSHGPRPPRRNPLGHLHQQGRARDEAAARPDAGPGRRGHAVARHLPLDRRPDPAHPCRTGAAEIQFHRARCRRPDPAAEAAAGGRQYRRQALAGADAGRPDRRLEESRPDAVAGAAGRSRGVRQRPRRQALRALSGTPEDPQRRRFRRSAAGKHPAVPRASRCAPAIPAPLQVHSGRRISGHQRRAVSVAAAAVAGADAGRARRCRPSFREHANSPVIPGRAEGTNPESRDGDSAPDSGFAPDGAPRNDEASDVTAHPPSPPRKTSAASATTTSRSMAGAAPRSTTSCASTTIFPAPR